MHSQEKQKATQRMTLALLIILTNEIKSCTVDFRVETLSLSHSAGFAHTEIHLVLQKSLTFMTIPTFHLLGYRLTFSDNKTSGLHFIKK